MVVVLVLVLVTIVVAGFGNVPYLHSERARTAAKIWLITLPYQHQDNNDFKTILTYFIIL